jgi:hypothetical protein
MKIIDFDDITNFEWYKSTEDKQFFFSKSFLRTKVNILLLNVDV